MKIAIFYHALFVNPGTDEPMEKAIRIVHEQMNFLHLSGLEEAADSIYCGVNGGLESAAFAKALLPTKADIVYHGSESRSENRTIQLIEGWARFHPGWAVLYWHPKGCFHPEDHTTNWRRCMTYHCVWDWLQCIEDLSRQNPFESVGAHWLRNFGPDGSQNYWGGNFWWANSDFLRTLQPIETKTACRLHGVESHAARFEAEVWIGGGPRLPIVRDYADHQVFTCPEI